MSPRTIEQNEALRAESHGRILECALGLFARHGYDRTSVAMIAEAAGVSHGLVYHYFPSKDELLRAIFERSMADVRESFAVAASGRDARGKIEALLRGSGEILRRNLDFWRLSYGTRMQASVLEKLGPAVPAWTAEILATLEGYFREAGAPEPGVEAAILFAIVDGIHQHFVLDPDRYPLDAVVDAVVARYAAAIASWQ
jgi:AcrR family transcriptional regulator